MFPFTFTPVSVNWVTHEDLDEGDGYIITDNHHDETMQSYYSIGQGVEDPDQDIKEACLHKKGRW